MAVHVTNTPEHTARGFLAAVRGIWSGVVGHLAQTMTQMQIARMQSILAGMSDEKLKRIGVSRADLRSHAEWLVTGER